jgi:hypothetical protein
MPFRGFILFKKYTAAKNREFLIKIKKKEINSNFNSVNSKGIKKKPMTMRVKQSIERQ